MKKFEKTVPWEMVKKLFLGFGLILIVGLISYVLLFALMMII